MGHQLYNHPRQLNLSTSLAILPGAKAYFYLSGTSTPATVYQNASLTTPHAVPVVADAAGVFAPIYLDSSVLYKVELQDTNGAVLSGYPVDPCNDLLPQSGNTLTQVTGTNTIEGTLSPDQALVAGLEVTIIPVATNTSAVTLELNSSNAVLDVLNNDGSALSGGELVIGLPATLKLDSGGDDWIITNPQVLKSRGREASPRLWTKLITDVSYTLLAADYHKIIEFFGSTAGQTITLPTSVLQTGDVVRVWNTSSVTVTLTATGNNLFWLTGAAVTGPAARTLAIGAAVDCICDGANWKVAGVGIS